MLPPGNQGPMRPSEALASHRSALRQILERHGLQNPQVFGSVLTGEDTEDSDLDLLVASGPGVTLFTLLQAEQDARQLTGVRVSVLTAGFLSPKFRDEVLNAAQPL